jgi:anti-sigma B factor antagonist
MFKGLFGKNDSGEQPFVVPQDRAIQPNMGENTSDIAAIEAIGQICILTVEQDRINAQVGAQLYELVATLAEQDYRLFVIDLQNTTYLDSAGLGVLIRLLKALEEIDGRIALSSVNPYVTSLFKITRMDRAFPICKDAIAAMDALNRAA